MSTDTHFTFGTHDLNDRVMIVAEIGNNHEGDAALAHDMIAAAAEAGADAVKFQTIEPARLVLPTRPRESNSSAGFTCRRRPSKTWPGPPPRIT